MSEHAARKSAIAELIGETSRVGVAQHTPVFEAKLAVQPAVEVSGDLTHGPRLVEVRHEVAAVLDSESHVLQSLEHHVAALP